MSNPHDITQKIPTGYEGQNIPDAPVIPPCGLADVDLALFNHFNKKIGFTIKGRDGLVKVPVIFAGGERFSLSKSKRPIKDKNGTFILPMIVIARTEINQSENLGGMGRGIGQDTGDLVITKRLDKSDRRYQNIVNRLALANQINLPSDGRTREQLVDDLMTSTVETRRKVGRSSFDTVTGEVLADRLLGNVTEVITVPYPEFFTVNYDVIIWSQYMTQMNSLLEQMMSLYNAQGNQFRIDAENGYWFVAYVDDAFTAGDNFEDYSAEERIVKYTFTIKVTGYLIASQHEGQSSPFRRYVSAPVVSFGVSVEEENMAAERRLPEGNGSGDLNKFILSDVAPLDRAGEKLVGKNHSPDMYPKYVVNPFTGKTEKKMLRVKHRYQRHGESVLSPADIFETEVIEDDM